MRPSSRGRRSRRRRSSRRLAPTAASASTSRRLSSGVSRPKTDRSSARAARASGSSGSSSEPVTGPGPAEMPARSATAATVAGASPESTLMRDSLPAEELDRRDRVGPHALLEDDGAPKLEPVRRHARRGLRQRRPAHARTRASAGRPPPSRPSRRSRLPARGRRALRARAAPARPRGRSRSTSSATRTAPPKRRAPPFPQAGGDRVERVCPGGGARRIGRKPRLHVRCVVPGSWNHALEHEPAVRERPGLVEAHRVDVRERPRRRSGPARASRGAQA